MRSILSTIFSFAVLCYAQAQNFEIVDTKGAFRGHIGENITSPIQIKNLSDKPIQLVIKRIDKIIGTSQETFFCWGDECLDPGASQIPLSKRIGPGETSFKLKSVLATGLVSGFSTVRYLIYDRDNPSDAIEHEVTYTVEDNSDKKLIFSSDDIKINEIYPNPVVDFAIVDYNITNEQIKAKLIIHNILGSVVGEFDLPYLETRLKIKTEEFNPGVYFYTLYIDNEGVMTRKLIIRK